MTIGTAHLACRELVELVTEYLEGTLSLADRMRFENHLADCDGCTEYLDQIRRTIALTGRLKESDVPEGLMAAFRDWNADR